MPIQNLPLGGLRISDTQPRDSGGLVRCHGGRIGPEGLLAPWTLTAAPGLVAALEGASPAVDIIDPTNQFFAFRTRLVLATADEVYLIEDLGDDAWTVTNVKDAPGLEWSNPVEKNLVADGDFLAIALNWSYTPGEFTQHTGGGVDREAGATPAALQHLGLSIPAGTYRVVVEGVCSVAAGATNVIVGQVGSVGVQHELAGVGAFSFTDDVEISETATYFSLAVGAGFEGTVTRYWVYPRAEDSPIDGGLWHASDFGPVQVLHGETDTLILSSGGCYLDQTSQIGAGCNFRGQLVLGGFTPTSIRSELVDWWTAKGAALPQLAENAVWWSSIGWANHLQFYCPEVVLGYDNQLEDVELAGVTGHTRLPAFGRVLCLKALKSGFVAYGENAVALFTPTEPSGFRIHTLADVGVLGRGCVAGDDREHVFVSARGEMWRIRDGNPVEARNLGYREFFEGAEGETLQVRHNPLLEHYYIMDGDGTAYCLSEQGLSTMNENRVSDWVLRGRTFQVNTGTDTALELDPRVYLETDDLTFGALDGKTIFGVQLRGRFTALTARVRLAYTFDDTPLFNYVPWVPVDPDGHAEVNASGRVFRVLVELADDTGFTRLEGLAVDFETAGKRQLANLATGG